MPRSRSSHVRNILQWLGTIYQYETMYYCRTHTIWPVSKVRMTLTVQSKLFKEELSGSQCLYCIKRFWIDLAHTFKTVVKLDVRLFILYVYLMTVLLTPVFLDLCLFIIIRTSHSYIIYTVCVHGPSRNGPNGHLLSIKSQTSIFVFHVISERSQIK